MMPSFPPPGQPRPRRPPGMNRRLLGALLLGTVASLTVLTVTYRLMLIKEAATLLLAAAVGTGLTAAFLTYLLTRPVVREMETLAAVARGLGRGGHLPSPGDLPRPHSAGELADLAEAFESLLFRLAEQVQKERRMETARRELVANVSHDLRTPLTALRAMVQALDDGVVPDAATRARYLRAIQREADHMSRLLDDLAQLTRLESGQLALEPAVLHLEDLLEDVLESMGVLLDQRRLRVDVRIASGVPAVAGDPSRLRQVITNGLENAVAFSPLGGLIVVALSHVDACVELTIDDEGPGVPADKAHELFDRFVRGDPARARRPSGVGTGAGLGLAISQEIIQLHGGTIELTNRIEGGARFRVVLPARPS